MTEKEKYSEWREKAVRERGLIEAIPYFNTEYIRSHNVTE